MCLGKVTQGPLQRLKEFQFRSRTNCLDSETFSALVRLAATVRIARPRAMTIGQEQKPILLFSDGACEGIERREVTCGAWVVDTLSMTKEMFGLRAPPRLIDRWQSEGNVQTIGQAELLPVALGFIKWEKLCRHRRFLVFVDNDSARAPLIRGSSNSTFSDQIVHAIAKHEAVHQTWVWYARVPSASNPADGPSRLRLMPASENLQAVQVEAPCIPEELM